MGHGYSTCDCQDQAKCTNPNHPLGACMRNIRHARLPGRSQLLSRGARGTRVPLPSQVLESWKREITSALRNSGKSSTKAFPAFEDATTEQDSGDISTDETAASTTAVATPSPTEQDFPLTDRVDSPPQERLTGHASLASIWPPESWTQTTDESVHAACSDLTVYPCLSSLMPALKAAKASKISWIMAHLGFEPGAAAYTSMFMACSGDVAKVMELWQAMNSRSGVKPNHISYGVLIRICGESDDCKQAERLLKEQLKAAESDINCQPSAITCRKFIAGLLKSKEVIIAMDWTTYMHTRGIFTEAVTYNNVILAALRAGVPMHKIAVLFRHMHDSKICASSEAYDLALPRVEQELGWQKAEDLLGNASQVGAMLWPQTCRRLMEIYSRVGAYSHCHALANWILEKGYQLEVQADMAQAALHAYAQAGHYQGATYMWQTLFVPRGFINGQIAWLVLSAFQKSGQHVYPNPLLQGELLHAFHYADNF